MKFVPPPRSGQVFAPSSSGRWPGSSTGRPSAPISFAHVVVDERLGDDHLAGDAIERVEEPVAVGEHHDLARLAVDRQVGEHRHLGRVPVVHVVRRELVVPRSLPVSASSATSEAV